MPGDPLLAPTGIDGRRTLPAMAKAESGHGGLPPPYTHLAGVCFGAGAAERSRK